MLGEEDYAKHPSISQSHEVTTDIRQAVECNATPANEKRIPKQSPGGAKIFRIANADTRDSRISKFGRTGRGDRIPDNGAIPKRGCRIATALQPDTP